MFAKRYHSGITFDAGWGEGDSYDITASVVCFLPMTSDSQATRIMTRDESRAVISSGDVLRARYRLDSQIGRGGMGVVYRATDLQLRREVAVKVISENSSTDAGERLIREARDAAALNHPHIISVYDVGEVNGTPFLVMELVQGSSLSKERPVELAPAFGARSRNCITNLRRSAACPHKQNCAPRFKTRQCAAFCGWSIREACRSGSGSAGSWRAHFTSRSHRRHAVVHGTRAGAGTDG